MLGLFVVHWILRDISSPEHLLVQFVHVLLTLFAEVVKTNLCCLLLVFHAFLEVLGVAVEIRNQVINLDQFDRISPLNLFSQGLCCLKVGHYFYLFSLKLELLLWNSLAYECFVVDYHLTEDDELRVENKFAEVVAEI